MAHLLEVRILYRLPRPFQKSSTSALYTVSQLALVGQPDVKGVLGSQFGCGRWVVNSDGQCLLCHAVPPLRASWFSSTIRAVRAKGNVCLL